MLFVNFIRGTNKTYSMTNYSATSDAGAFSVLPDFMITLPKKKGYNTRIPYYEERIWSCLVMSIKNFEKSHYYMLVEISPKLFLSVQKFHLWRLVPLHMVTCMMVSHKSPESFQPENTIQLENERICNPKPISFIID